MEKERLKGQTGRKTKAIMQTMTDAYKDRQGQKGAEAMAKYKRCGGTMKGAS